MTLTQAKTELKEIYGVTVKTDNGIDKKYLVYGGSLFTIVIHYLHPPQHKLERIRLNNPLWGAGVLDSDGEVCVIDTVVSVSVSLIEYSISSVANSLSNASVWSLLNSRIDSTRLWMTPVIISLCKYCRTSSDSM